MKPATPIDPAQRKKLWKVIACAAAACLGISAAGYFVGLSPAIAHVSERKADMDELANRQQKGAQAKAELTRTRKRLLEARREVDDLPLRLEPASVVNRRLNRLAEAATAAGVNLNEMQPMPAIDTQHYQTVPIRVTGSGSYPACAAFLHTLRTQFPDTAVQSIDAQNASPGRDNNIANFRLDLEWHTTQSRK
jgi:Tfp pilus assembly protein PilO